MRIKCGNCGSETIVTASLIKGVMGGGLIASGALGWVTYSFAGILGFHGGAALIAILLISGGSAVLLRKEQKLVALVGNRIADFFNMKGYKCECCEAVDWTFSGFEKADVINGDEHKRELVEAVAEAKKDLIIASGFLSSNVVDDEFVNKLEGALARGVRVRLVFSNEQSHSSDWMIQGYREALNKLKNLSKKYQSLELIQKHTHQKGIVVDDRYAIVGSFNFLSNKKAERNETSIKNYDSNAIKKIRMGFLENK